MNCQRNLERDGSRFSGFTLVELQIAILLSAIIAVLMTGALQSAIQAWKKTGVHQDLAERSFLTQQFLRRHLNNMRFPRSSHTENGAVLPIAGNSVSLHFVAPFPAYNSDGLLYWWTLKNRASEDGRVSLVLEYFPFDSLQLYTYSTNNGIKLEENQDAELQYLTVSDRLMLSAIEYFDPESDQVDNWQENWEPARHSPTSLKLEFTEINSEGHEIRYETIAITPQFSNQALDFSYAE